MDETTFNLILNLTKQKLIRFHGKKVMTSEEKLFLSPENLLALLFNWCFEYRSMRSLSMDFKIPHGTIEAYIPRLVDLVHEELKRFVVPPANIKRITESGLLTGTCLYVDSFPIQCNTLYVRPDYNDKESEDRSKFYWFAGKGNTNGLLRAKLLLD
jgi:hypothetical protein